MTCTNPDTKTLYSNVQKKSIPRNRSCSVNKGSSIMKSRFKINQTEIHKKSDVQNQFFDFMSKDPQTFKSSKTTTDSNVYYNY
jgi:hypothetical protein